MPCKEFNDMCRCYLSYPCRVLETADATTHKLLKNDKLWSLFIQLCGASRRNWVYQQKTSVWMQQRFDCLHLRRHGSDILESWEKGSQRIGVILHDRVQLLGHGQQEIKVREQSGFASISMDAIMKRYSITYYRYHFDRHARVPSGWAHWPSHGPSKRLSEKCFPFIRYTSSVVGFGHTLVI